jgi:metal-responsive CopG/Arc/MetJ family transcriptional regulator
MNTATKTKRIDITLPEQTIDQIDNTWKDFGFASRSAFLNEAAKNFTVRLKKANLKKSLRAGYQARAERDANLNSEMEILSFELD